MDIDFGDTCSMACPHCFRRDSRVDKIQDNALTSEEIIDYIKQAKELGLECIKILGRGEPFENEEFLGFLRTMTDLDIGVAVFTKGHVLGCDSLAEKYNSKYGINSSKELIEEIKNLKVSILLGFNTFDDGKQKAMLGIDKYKENNILKDSITFRNNALVSLVKAGFNEYKEGEATRLCLMAAPFNPETVDELFDIYSWAHFRNIYVVSCPTMISGKGIDIRAKEEMNYGYDAYIKKIQKMYVKIYTWAINKNLISFDTFKRDGVSLYVGAYPCIQVAAGFYLQLSGQVVQCPGRIDASTTFIKDIRESDLKTVWVNSLNGKRAKNTSEYNYHCVARDGHSIPANFYSDIEKMVFKNLTQVFEHVK